MALPTVANSIEGDCIITAMLLGLAREIVGNKNSLTISAKAEAEVKEAAREINAALKTLPIKNIPDVKTSDTEKWNAGSYITGKQHGKGRPGSLMAETFNYDDLTYQRVQSDAPKMLPKGGQVL